jgi:hypothetical protein
MRSTFSCTSAPARRAPESRDRRRPLPCRGIRRSSPGRQGCAGYWMAAQAQRLDLRMPCDGRVDKLLGPGACGSARHHRIGIHRIGCVQDALGECLFNPPRFALEAAAILALPGRPCEGFRWSRRSRRAATADLHPLASTVALPVSITRRAASAGVPCRRCSRRRSHSGVPWAGSRGSGRLGDPESTRPCGRPVPAHSSSAGFGPSVAPAQATARRGRFQSQ